MFPSGTGRLVRMSPERRLRSSQAGPGNWRFRPLLLAVFAFDFICSARIASCIQDKTWSRPSKSMHLYITTGKLCTMMKALIRRELINSSMALIIRGNTRPGAA